LSSLLPGAGAISATSSGPRPVGSGFQLFLYHGLHARLQFPGSLAFSRHRAGLYSDAFEVFRHHTFVKRLADQRQGVTYPQSSLMHGQKGLTGGFGVLQGQPEISDLLVDERQGFLLGHGLPVSQCECGTGYRQAGDKHPELLHGTLLCAMTGRCRLASCHALYTGGNAERLQKLWFKRKDLPIAAISASLVKTGFRIHPRPPIQLPSTGRFRVHCTSITSLDLALLMMFGNWTADQRDATFAA
jgi:hypothetical protein